jgi:hypothetical protein
MFGGEITVHSYILNQINASNTNWESLRLEIHSLVKTLVRRADDITMWF